MSSCFVLITLLVICNPILEVKSYTIVSDGISLGFDWTNCGNGSVDPIVVNSMDAEPDPINIPGTISLSLDAAVKTTIAEPTSLEIVIKKKIFGVFVQVPCIDNFGTCTYSNPCNLLQNITCPPEVLALGWNCRCPLTPNEIKIEKQAIDIPKLNLPSFVENGEYKVQATLMNGDERVLCYQLHCSLHNTGILVH